MQESPLYGVRDVWVAADLRGALLAAAAAASQPAVQKLSWAVT